MSDEFLVPRLPRGWSARIELPGSKSISNRALLLAALGTAPVRIQGLLDSRDIRDLDGCLRALGATVVRSGSETTVTPIPPQPEVPEAALQCGENGTAARFLLAVAGVLGWPVILDGRPSLRRRPMAPFVAALEGAGARIEALQEAGHLPLRIRSGVSLPARVVADGSISSQFASGLLLALARRPGPEVAVAWPADLVSRPYLDLTLAMLQDLVEVQPAPEGMEEARRRAAARMPERVQVPPDASSATVWLALSAIHGATVSLPGLPGPLPQADLELGRHLQRVGCVVQPRHPPEEAAWVCRGGLEQGLDADLGRCPDSVPVTVAALARAPGPSRIRGVAHLRHKESDRLAALEGCFRPLGVAIQVEEDGLSLHPERSRPPPEDATLDPANDHRIAMALAAWGTAGGCRVRIQHPEVVAKSYPTFLTELANLAEQLQASPRAPAVVRGTGPA